MRISTKSAAALAIISTLLTALPAEARGRYRSGYDGYRGGGYGWSGYAYNRGSSRPGGYYRYGAYPRDRGAYPSYYGSSYYDRGYYGYVGYPAYYGGYHGHNDDDLAIAIGAGLLGVMLGTAISRNRDHGDQGRSDHYQYGSSVGSYSRQYYPSERRVDRSSAPAPRADSVDDVDRDGDPYNYYRNGGNADGDRNDARTSEADNTDREDPGPVGM